MNAQSGARIAAVVFTAVILISKTLSGALSPGPEGERVCCSPQRSQSSRGSKPPLLPTPPQNPHLEHWPRVLLVACGSVRLTLASPPGPQARGGGQLGILIPPRSLELTLCVTPKGPREAGVRQRGAASCLMKSVQTSCSLIRFSAPKGATLDLCSPLKLTSTRP